MFYDKAYFKGTNEKFHVEIPIISGSVIAALDLIGLSILMRLKAMTGAPLLSGPKLGKA